MNPAPEAPAPAADPAIEILNLQKIYNGVAAVNGLTVIVPSGIFFGFLGPNGAGKTTTIKILMGLAQPTAGSVKMLGLCMPGDSLAIRQQIGVVPDDTLLFDYLTGAEYLEFVGRLYGLARPLAKERSAELLELLQLPADRKLIGEYSKGMRKRVAMAAALIHRPRLYLMDEPFEGVDAVGARLMKDILLHQISGGATVFLTSHVLEVVERLCDQVAIINQGKVLAQGSIPQLREQAATSGAGTLEEIFVNLVGAGRYTDSLDWL